MAHTKPNTQQIIIIIDYEPKLSGPLHDDPTLYIKCPNRWFTFSIFSFNSINIYQSIRSINLKLIQINKIK